MAVHALADLTWTEVRALADGGGIAILPTGAIEAHGPHLPLATDVIIAEAMARAGAERLSERGHQAVLLPTLPFTPALFAADFAGTISVSARSVADMVADIAASVAGHGFRTLAIANAHFDPAHVEALGEAVRLLATRTGFRVVFPDITRRPWVDRLTAEFRSGACHAGRYEGSIVMAARPDLVREEVRRGLPPNPTSLSEAIRGGKHSFTEAGSADAYFGAPAEASAAEGHRTIETLGTILEEAILMEVGDDA